MAQIEINGNFEGYLWESDKKAPEVYYGKKILPSYTFDSEMNPFIIEGQLFDALTGLSVSIKYVDGEYKIKKYFIDKKNGNQFYSVTKDDNGERKIIITCEVKNLYYKGNSQLEGHNLHFYELWEEKPDPLCCNMSVLEATKVIFAGFLDKQTKE
jgi:CRISPR type III-associated protein (TIGR04423 family)